MGEVCSGICMYFCSYSSGRVILAGPHPNCHGAVAMVTVQKARAWSTPSGPTVRQVFHENPGLCRNRGSNGVEFIKSCLSSDCHPLAGCFSLFDRQFPHLQSQAHNNSSQRLQQRINIALTMNVFVNKKREPWHSCCLG